MHRKEDGNGKIQTEEMGRRPLADRLDGPVGRGLHQRGNAKLLRVRRANTGQFHFGYVHGEIDYRLGKRDGKPAVEFTWDGHDEMDPAQGRGWAVLEGEELKGMFSSTRATTRGSC